MKKILITILVLTLLGGVAAYLLINKSHPDMASLTTDVSITATDLFSDYEENEKKANDNYLNKIIEISGEVVEFKLDKNGKIKVHLLTEDMIFGVICELDDYSKHESTSFNPKNS